jgi:hypothetical protein
MIMYKTNIFFTVAALFSLVLIFSSTGLACGTKPAQEPASPPPVTEPVTEPTEPAPVPTTPPPSTEETPPAPTETGIPTNYTTYTDEDKFFSISYPSDWETVMSFIEPYAKEAISKLKSGLPLERGTMVFQAGRRTAAGDVPNINVAVEPTTEATSTLDAVVESSLEVVKASFPDYRELSRVKTTVDGREAVIVELEGTYQGQTPLHDLEMITLADQTIWTVTCTSLAADFADWKNDFNTIVRSLRISK